MRIGFVGLGTAGKNAATCIRRKRFAMIVDDIRPDAVEGLAAMGAVMGKSPADVLVLRDVVVTMVCGPKCRKPCCAGRRESWRSIAWPRCGLTGRRPRQS